MPKQNVIPEYTPAPKLLPLPLLETKSKRNKKKLEYEPEKPAYDAPPSKKRSTDAAPIYIPTTSSSSCSNSKDENLSLLNLDDCAEELDELSGLIEDQLKDDEGVKKNEDVKAINADKPEIEPNDIKEAEKPKSLSILLKEQEKLKERRTSSSSTSSSKHKHKSSSKSKERTPNKDENKKTERSKDKERYKDAEKPKDKDNKSKSSDRDRDKNRDKDKDRDKEKDKQRETSSGSSSSRDKTDKQKSSSTTSLSSSSHKSSSRDKERDKAKERDKHKSSSSSSSSSNTKHKTSRSTSTQKSHSSSKSLLSEQASTSNSKLSTSISSELKTEETENIFATTEEDIMKECEMIYDQLEQEYATLHQEKSESQSKDANKLKRKPSIDAEDLDSKAAQKKRVAYENADKLKSYIPVVIRKPNHVKNAMQVNSQLNYV